MSHGISLSRGAGVGLGTGGCSGDGGLHLHLNFITVTLTGIISPCAVAWTMHTVEAKLPHNSPAQGERRSWAIALSGREGRSHQLESTRAPVYLSKSRVGLLAPLRLLIPRKSKASWNFHPLFLNSKPDFHGRSVAEIQIGDVGSS